MRIHRQGGPKMRLSLRWAGPIQKDPPQNTVRDWIAGKPLQFSAKLLLGKFVFSLSPVFEAEARMGSHEVRVCFDRGLIFLDGLRSIRHFVIGRTHHDVSRCGVWTELHDASEHVS